MPAQDLYENRVTRLEGPANRAFNVTPSDTLELPFVTTGLYVGTGGNVALKDRVSGDTILFKNVPAGGGIPIRTARVLATGTTAADIVGLA